MHAQRRALDRIGSALLERRAFADSMTGGRGSDRVGSSLWDDKPASSRVDSKPFDSLDYVDYPPVDRRGLDSIGSSLIDRRAIDKIGGSLLRKRAG